jgi:Domain of unknown function (DUF4157)
VRFREPAKGEDHDVDSAPAPVSTPENTLENAAFQGGNQMMVRLIESSPDDAAPSGDDLAMRIRGRLGKGSALPSDVRSTMESTMGQGFGNVVVHRDAEAANLASQLGAHAFTTGQDVFFGSGAYDPGSPAGQATLRHELHHTVQQSSGAVEGKEWSPGLVVSDPHDHDEREAAEVAHNPPGSSLL